MRFPSSFPDHAPFFALRHTKHPTNIHSLFYFPQYFPSIRPPSASAVGLFDDKRFDCCGSGSRSTVSSSTVSSISTVSRNDDGEAAKSLLARNAVNCCEFAANWVNGKDPQKKHAAPLRTPDRSTGLKLCQTMVWRCQTFSPVGPRGFATLACLNAADGFSARRGRCQLDAATRISAKQVVYTVIRTTNSSPCGNTPP